MASGEAVANEPRLFVGQIPAKCTEEDLWPLFSPYGTVKNLHILRGPDTKPRGCAMVLYTKWAQAEAAAEALDGAAALTGRQGRPLVVHFANPRKPPPGLPAEPGLAPKKLFVGQVPRDVTEETLKPYFAPYGEIEHINILRTPRGLSAGCGFVQYKRWSQAENAIEAHNGKTRLGSSEAPLVVKFADAKRREQQMQALNLGFKHFPGWLEANKPLGDPAADFAYQLSQQQFLMNQGNPLLGQIAVQQQMQNLMTNAGYPGSYPPTQYPLGDPGILHRAQAQDKQHSDRLQGYSMPNLEPDRNLSSDMDPLAGQMLSEAPGVLGSSMGLPSQGGSASRSSLPTASAADLAQQLSELSIAGLGSQQQDAGVSSSGLAFAPQGSQQQAYGRHLQDFSSSLGARGSSGMGGLPYGSLLPGPDMAGSEHASRPWGQRINSNDKLNEWKLFIGQVPLEANEEHLWTLFSPIGQVLELYVLRNNNAKSRGCAFVTYASKQLAEQAITQLNGRPMSSGKTLVVKFADRASASKGGMGNLLDLCVQ